MLHHLVCGFRSSARFAPSLAGCTACVTAASVACQMARRRCTGAAASTGRPAGDPPTVVAPTAAASASTAGTAVQPSKLWIQGRRHHDKQQQWFQQQVGQQQRASRAAHQQQQLLLQQRRRPHPASVAPAAGGRCGASATSSSCWGCPGGSPSSETCPRLIDSPQADACSQQVGISTLPAACHVKRLVTSERKPLSVCFTSSYTVVFHILLEKCRSAEQVAVQEKINLKSATTDPSHGPAKCNACFWRCCSGACAGWLQPPRGK